ncbi:MAG: DUF362 domain-containing protein [Myxococcota bacterium]|nr:DUF362 domain-containing protein [Myxococcota bacterium]
MSFDDHLRLTRRRFGALTATGVASLVLPGAPRARAEGVSAADLSWAPGEVTPVAVRGVPRGAGEEETSRAVREAALAVTDFGWLSRGDTVLIKPACNSGNVYPATTDPVALRAMIALLRERGAGRVLVADMSGVQFVRFGPDHLRGSTRELMRSAGMEKTALDAGAEVHAFEEAGWDGFFEDTPATGPSWTGALALPNVLREVDHVVLMPRCSRHLLAGSTLALKAAVGWWRHDSRLEYHRDASTFSAKTAEANTVPAIASRQRLVLTSATKVLATFGPDDGHVDEPETGLVFASPSAVAHDMVSLAWLLESRRGLPEGMKSGPIDDPNTSQWVVNLANRVVVRMLGGFGEAFRTEGLPRYDLEAVWDDRVLRRAFEIAGGVPRIALTDDGGSLPPALRTDLEDALTLPS